MVAAIDIGNTTVVACLIEESQGGFEKKITQRRNLNLLEWLEALGNVDDFVVSSVVPSLSDEIFEYCKKANKKYTFIHKNMTHLVDFSLYSTNIGADRICTSVGAACNYELPVCVVDMGTATTVSLVDKNRVYKGGLIMPGLTTLFKSLSSFTSQLPEIQMKEKPSEFLGFNTHDNILNGVYYLANEGLSGIIGRVRKENPGVKVIGTGGWANIFNKIYDFLDENLIFKGIRAIYFKEIKKKEGKSVNFSL